MQGATRVRERQAACAAALARGTEARRENGQKKAVEAARSPWSGDATARRGEWRTARAHESVSVLSVSPTRRCKARRRKASARSAVV